VKTRIDYLFTDAKQSPLFTVLTYMFTRAQCEAYNTT